MNDKIIELGIEVREKVAEDWLAYRKDVLAQDKETILRDSYRNAVAGEWLYFFDNTFKDDYLDDDCNNINNIEVVLNKLLGLKNIIVTLIDYVLGYDSIDYSQDGFSCIFDDYFEEE